MILQVKPFQTRLTAVFRYEYARRDEEEGGLPGKINSQQQELQGCQKPQREWWASLRWGQLKAGARPTS
jgi:hypothetical protein